jgi:hypothetical protein
LPHPVDPGEHAIETALLRLQWAVGQLEAAAETATLPAAAEDEDHRSEAADEDADAARETGAIAAVLVRLDETVARLRAVVGEDADA